MPVLRGEAAKGAPGPGHAPRLLVLAPLALAAAVLLAGCSHYTDLSNVPEEDRREPTCFPWYFWFQVVNDTDSHLSARIGLVFPDNTTLRTAVDVSNHSAGHKVLWGTNYSEAQAVVGAKDYFDEEKQWTGSGDFVGSPKTPRLMLVRIEGSGVTVTATDERYSAGDPCRA